MTNREMPDFPIWLPEASEAPSAEAGDFFTVFAPFSDRYLLSLVVDLSQDDVLITPVSDETRYAAEWDFFLSNDRLGYAAVAELWNTTFVLREQLRERVGTATDPTLFIEAYDRMTSGQHPPDGIDQGPDIRSDLDPRLAFRSIERERVSSYAEPAKTLACGGTLGQVIQSARSSRGLAVEDVAAETGLSIPTIGRIENDCEDLRSNVSIQSFAKLLSMLVVPPAKRLLSYAEDAVLRNDRGSQFTAGPLFARSRRGIRSDIGHGAATEGSPQAAREWVEKLHAEMVPNP